MASTAHGTVEMTPSILRPLLLAAPLAALATTVAAPPASSADVLCSRAAHAYATIEISLIDPLKKLQGCIKDRLEKAKDKPDEKGVKAPKHLNDWQACRAIAARYASDPETVTTKQFAELGACVDQSIKEFK